MKRKLIALFIIICPVIARAQTTGIPASYLKDSLPALIEKAKGLLDRAYMAQTLLATVDTLPDWEGYPVKLYQYSTSNDLYTGKPKTAKVYLLNPSPQKLVMWILTACWEAKHSVDSKYTNALFQSIRGQSGGQFPVLGIVMKISIRGISRSLICLKMV